MTTIASGKPKGKKEWRGALHELRSLQTNLLDHLVGSAQENLEQVGEMFGPDNSWLLRELEREQMKQDAVGFLEKPAQHLIGAKNRSGAAGHRGSKSESRSISCGSKGAVGAP